MEVARVFQESQTSVATHRKLAVQLRREHENYFSTGTHNAFFDQFCGAVLRILPIKKAEPNVERIVKFIGLYIGSISPREDEDIDATPEGVFQFIEGLLRYVSRGMTARDKVVRFRSHQLVMTILQHASAVSDECCDDLRAVALGRLSDRDASVRTQAVLILTLLLSERDSASYNETVAKFVDIMEHDTSADVRRAALVNLPKRKRYYAALVDRSLDISATNRRAVYSRVMREIGDFRLLRRDSRERLLKNGLLDREPAVRNAATSMLLSQWLQTVDNDMIKLLGRLDVLSSDVAQHALDALFKARHDVVTERLHFEADFWEGLAPEGAFLLRCFNQFCRESNMTELAEQRLPELAQFAQILARRWEKYCAAGPDEERDEDFIVEQLLIVASTYDFSDEFGRQSLLQTLDTILTGTRTPSDAVIAKCVQTLRKALSLVSDFMLKITDILDDIENVQLESGDPDVSRLTSALVQYSIVESTLRCLDAPYTDLATLNSLYGMLRPTLQSRDVEIWERGVVSIGLLCLLNKAQADAHFDEVLDQYDESPDLDMSGADINVSVVQVAADVLLTHRMFPEQAKRARDIIVHAFGQGGELQVVSAKVLAKLFLCDLFSSEGAVLGRLVAEYFTSAETPELQQVLSFFVPVYALTSVDNQRRIAEQFDTIFDLAVESDIGATHILAQLVEWTSPERTGHATTATTHGVLAIAMLRRARHSPKLLQRTLLSAAGKLTLVLSGEQTDTISGLIGELREQIQDRVCQNSLQAFERHFEKGAVSVQDALSPRQVQMGLDEASAGVPAVSTPLPDPSTPLHVDSSPSESETDDEAMVE